MLNGKFKSFNYSWLSWKQGNWPKQIILSHVSKAFTDKFYFSTFCLKQESRQRKMTDVTRSQICPLREPFNELAWQPNLN